MNITTLTATAVAALLGFAGFVAGAQADPVGQTLNVSLADSPYTITFGGSDQASLTFSGQDNGFFSPVGSIFVSTDGSAKVHSTFGHPSGYKAGQSVPPILGDFEAYSSPAGIAYSGNETFSPFEFTLDDGIHYGYAEVYGYSDTGNGLMFTPTLMSFAYNTTAGASITTGEAFSPLPTAVPEPSALIMFGLGLGLIGLGIVRRRRRS